MPKLLIVYLKCKCNWACPVFYLATHTPVPREWVPSAALCMPHPRVALRVMSLGSVPWPQAWAASLDHSPVFFCKGSPAAPHSWGSRRPLGRSCVVPEHSPAPSRPVNDRHPAVDRRQLPLPARTQRFGEHYSQEGSPLACFALVGNKDKGHDAHWVDEELEAHRAALD